MSDRLRFDRVAIAPAIRTAIVAPIACMAVVLEQTDQVNGAKVWDAAAGGSYKELAAGAERHIGAVQPYITYPGPTHPRPQRFAAGETIAWVEADAGTGPIAAEFVL